MKSLVTIMELQLSYFERLAISRKSNFRESFTNPIFENEPPAAEVFIHGITPLYKSCYKLINPKNNETGHSLDLNTNLEIPNQYIDLLRKTLKILKQLERSMTENDLAKRITHPRNPEVKISQLEWISLNIFHSITHIGQALRLQALYLRNRKDLNNKEEYLINK